MKKLLPILIGLSLSGFSTLSQAENLMQVYQQARLSNPELRKSAADRDAAFEKINEARSPLLPQLGLGADYTYSNGYRDANGVNSNATSASLQLTQSIFDMSKWRALTLQEKSAGIQDVTYQTDQQTLILNTATAYFNVLNAIDVLSYTQAQKEAIYRQLDQTTQRFNVGLVAITDVQNARAQYDTVLANEVTARNNLDNAVEQLRQITGNYYPELAALNVENFQTDKPQPVNALLKEAENRNLSLLQARLSQDLAREQIRLAQDGHLPTLDLTASTGVSDTSYSGSKTHGGATGNQYDDSNMGQNKIGLSFSLPLYQGGMVNSQVKQAQYNFVGASEQLESAHRSVVQTVRSSFNNIIVTLANSEGQVISWSSAGKMGFRGSKKNTPYAAQMAAQDCAKVAYDLGLRKVKAYVKGPGNGRESAVRTIHGAGIEVTEIIDVTPLPHNGCRPPKRRRV